MSFEKIIKDYVEKFAQTRQEQLGVALRQLNDTELQSLQALGAQAQRTGNEIAQVDKQLTRVLNGKGGSGGTTTTTSGGGGKGGSLVDVSAARTQSEATDLIARQLMSDGLIKGSAEYQDAFDAAWTANGVSELPMQ